LCYLKYVELYELYYVEISRIWFDSSKNQLWYAAWITEWIRSQTAFKAKLLEMGISLACRAALSLIQERHMIG